MSEEKKGSPSAVKSVPDRQLELSARDYIPVTRGREADRAATVEGLTDAEIEYQKASRVARGDKHGG